MAHRGRGSSARAVLAKWVRGKETKRAGSEDEGKEDEGGHATYTASLAACASDEPNAPSAAPCGGVGGSLLEAKLKYERRRSDAKRRRCGRYLKMTVRHRWPVEFPQAGRHSGPWCRNCSSPKRWLVEFPQTGRHNEHGLGTRRARPTYHVHSIAAPGLISVTLSGSTATDPSAE